jgi:hypothetical protein
MARKPIIKWNGGKIVGQTKARITENMGKVVQMMRSDVIQSINVSQRTAGAGGARRGLDPSRPGDPPKRVEGDLVRSIVADVRSEPTRIVGTYGSTQGKKALALEFGTRTMAARPFLRPPLLRKRNDIVRILSR